MTLETISWNTVSQYILIMLYRVRDIELWSVLGRIRQKSKNTITLKQGKGDFYSRKPTSGPEFYISEVWTGLSRHENDKNIFLHITV